MPCAIFVENQIVHRICQGDPEENEIKCGPDADCCQNARMKNVVRVNFLSKKLDKAPPFASIFCKLTKKLDNAPPLASMFYRLTKKLDTALPSCINVLHTYGNKMLTNVANPEEPLA